MADITSTTTPSRTPSGRFVSDGAIGLFSDTPAGASASAALYSLIETAKANGLDPYLYLRHIFTELPKAQALQDIEALLPYNLQPAILSPHQTSIPLTDGVC